MAWYLEQNFYSQLRAADLVLQSAQQSHARLRAAGTVPIETFSQVIRGLQKLLPGSTAFRGSDRAGAVIFGEGADARPPLSIETRRFFTDARASSGLVIGMPLRSRVSRRWVLPIARSLRTGTGEFDGVIYVNLDLADINATLSGLRIGPRGVASMFNERGEILLRSLDMLDAQDEHAARILSRTLKQALELKRANTPIEATSAVDGVERLTMYRQVGSYPLTLRSAWNEVQCSTSGAARHSSRLRSGWRWWRRQRSSFACSSAHFGVTLPHWRPFNRPGSMPSVPTSPSRSSWPT
ncbi:hypothetical protein BH11PSE8_BH11PSE8_32820 [soil metagenome]